jgi:hypothetical protein
MFNRLVIPSPFPLCRLWPLSPLFLPFLVRLFKSIFKLGPFFPLVARVGPNMMPHVLNVVPFFQDMYVLVSITLSSTHAPSRSPSTYCLFTWASLCNFGPFFFPLCHFDFYFDLVLFSKGVSNLWVNYTLIICP